MNNDIDHAIEDLRKNGTRYAKSERYYSGEHHLAFASEKFQNTFGNLFREFALNLCPAICDAVRDKLVITGFGVDEISKSYAFTRDLSHTPFTPEGVTLTKDIDRIWSQNRMAVRSGEVHKEALKNGDAYVIVWPNAAGEPVIYQNKAGSCTVVFDEETPGKILWAAKYWRTADKHTRLNLFYPDRIEKYISVRESEITLPDGKEFVPVGTQAPLPVNVQAGSLRSDAVIPNPYGVVPVFHFANNADIGTLGQSELENAIPVQDGLNKSVLDMLVAMEFSAYRQRWAAGIEIEYDNDGKPIAPFTAGVDHLWIAQEPNATFGDFQGSNLEHFLKVKDSFRVDIASVTGTPLHYLMPFADNFPSGESMRKAETRFVSKIRARQQAFGQVWSDLMSFALRIAGHGRGVRLLTNWEDASPLSEREMLENILLKKKIGIPAGQALIEAGYGDEDVKRMTEAQPPIS